MSNNNQVTVISPSLYAKLDLNEDCRTIGCALRHTGQAEDAVVKVNGQVQNGDYVLNPGDTLVIVPGAVAKGGFDGGSR